MDNIVHGWVYIMQCTTERVYFNFMDLKEDKELKRAQGR